MYMSFQGALQGAPNASAVIYHLLRNLHKDCNKGTDLNSVSSVQAPSRILQKSIAPYQLATGVCINKRPHYSIAIYCDMRLDPQETTWNAYRYLSP